MENTEIREKLIRLAENGGADHAAVLAVEELTIIPEYRKFCEDNLCGNYDKLPACPPASGTVEEMTGRMLQYEEALILQTVVKPEIPGDLSVTKAAKRELNILTEKIMDEMKGMGLTDLLMMGAGPWKSNSCMSAYCVDAQKMADKAGMQCWANDGCFRFFSLVLYHPQDCR